MSQCRRSRKRRLSDYLPASELIRRDAPPWQVAHALLALGQQLAQKRKLTVRECLSEHSPIHSWVHLWDLNLKGRRKWVKIILSETEELERKLDGRGSQQDGS